MEEWRDVRGYEGLYQVSNTGKVRSLNYMHTGKIHQISPRTTKDGYQDVLLHKNGVRKLIRVHRLVAIAFIPNPYNKPEVDHIDTNPSNNNVENLRWVTSLENKQNPISLQHRRDNVTGSKNPMYGKCGSKHKRSKAVVCISTGEVFESICIAANKYNLSTSLISSCCKGKRNYHGKLPDGTKLRWKYK